MPNSKLSGEYPLVESCPWTQSTGGHNPL